MTSFDKSQISSTVSVEEANNFFSQNGIFYCADAAIAKQATKIGFAAHMEQPNILKELQINDPRLERILQSYQPSFTYIFGGRKGPYFASSIQQMSDHAALAYVYIFTNPTTLHIFPESHKQPLIGTKAANGLYQIPYPYLTSLGLEPSHVEMEEGGILVLHPRSVFGVRSEKESFAMAYGCQKIDATLQ